MKKMCKSFKLKKNFFILLFTLSSFFAVAQSFDEELEYYTFGSESENALVLCFTKQEGKESLLNAMYSLVESKIIDFSKINYQLVLAITSHDYTSLPSDVEVEKYVGLKKMLERISKYKNVSTFVVTEADDFIVNYSTEISKSPFWQLKLLYNSLTNDVLTNYKNSFSPKYFDKTSGEVLNLFFQEENPCIVLKTPKDFPLDKVAQNLISNYESFFSTVWEKNYVLFSLGRSVLFVSERISIIFIIVFIFVIFFTAFIFGLIAKKTFSKLEFFLYCIFYGVFFLLNFFALFSSRFLTESIFNLEFGSSNVKAFLSTEYVVLFLCIYVIFILCIKVLLELLLKKYNQVGKILNTFYSAGCLINFFVLIALDFFVYPFAFLTYLFSYFFNFGKSLTLKLIMLVLAFLPSIVYFYFSLLSSNRMLNIIDSNLIFLVAFFLPIVFTTGYNFFKHNIKKVILTLLAGLTVFIIAIVILLPNLAQKKNISFEVRQFFDAEKNTTCIYNPPYKVSKDIKFLNLPPTLENSSSFINVDYTFENYLDRSIATLTINSTVEVEALEILITNEFGIPVYEADKTIVLDGNKAKIITSQKVSMPFTITFSSEKDANLNILVTAYSFENPFGTKLDKNIFNVNDYFLLKLETSLDIKP